MGNQGIGKLLQSIYERLLARYGPQHWWPAREPFEVIVGAILTQSTAWTNVEKAISNLRKAERLSPAALRNLSEEELARLIHPCGYHHVKARRLKAFAHFFGQQYGDSLARLVAEETAILRQKLLGIYGIGEETADSIILYAAGKPVFVIDAYTRRIIDRMGLSPSDHSYAGYQKLFMSNLPADSRLFNEYHALLVRHGKEACRKHPICADCCLKTPQTDVLHPGNTYPCATAIKSHA